MFFAPPSKVARTQRQSMSSSTPPFTYKRASEVASGHSQSSPITLEEAVLVDTINKSRTPAASFLSGAGTHMCWMVDENQKLLRLWNVHRPGWERAAPRLAEIPSFAATTEGLPVFVSEMSAEEESLAFCSERGAISSLDHSIEVQMLDGDDAVRATSFTCGRRELERGAVIVTVVGTTNGLLVVDLKHDGTHTIAEFDRRDPASFHWMRGSHNNLRPARPDPLAAAATDVAQDHEEVQEALSASELLAMENDASASTSIWDAVRSVVGGSRLSSARQSRKTSVVDRHPSLLRALHRDSVDGTGARGAHAVWPLSAGEHPGRGDSALAFILLQLRFHYPEQVVAVNAAGEVFLLDFGPMPPASGQATVQIKWATSLPAALGRRGHVLALTESRHKICLLYHVAGTATHPLPAIWVVTVDASLGKVVNFVVLNTVADVVRAATTIPSHQIRLFADDTHREILISLGAYLLRVNNQVGVRQPCSSEDTVHIKSLEQPIASLLLDGTRIVTMDVNGPQLTVRDVHAPQMVMKGGAAESGGVGFDGDFSGEAELKRLLDAVRSDSKLSLDAAILYTSEALYAQDPHRANSARTSASGNWARSNLNAEDEGIILRVTRQLTARQQSHRRFLLAVLKDARVLEKLAPETVAQLLSAQEALVSMCAVRSLQNVGLQRGGTADDFALVRQVLPPVTEMLKTAQGGGSYLLQRRPTRGATSSGRYTEEEVGSAQQHPRLVTSAQQLERCQQLLRRAIVHVADELRAADVQGSFLRDGSSVSTSTARTTASPVPLTAAELCFSNPLYLIQMLKFVGNYMMEVRDTVSLPLEEKYAECYAVGCVYVVVAQTIAESREDVGKVYAVPAVVAAHCWTSSTDALSGVELCFSQACVQLSQTLADMCDGPAGSSRSSISGAATLAALTLQHKCDMLDLLGYLLYFSLTNSAHRNGDFTATAITNTILRPPFVTGPVGYPHGAPTPSKSCVEIGRRVLQMSESMALYFNAMPVLMALSLATPHDDPTSNPADYERLQRYCQQNRLVLDAALLTLWQQRREWELLSLAAILPGCPDVRVRRNDFLEAHAPHLLWLAEPTRFDALDAEGQTSPPYIPYGDRQLTHRSRCNAVARLAWVATGAPTSSHYDDLQLSEVIVHAQHEFLAAAYSSITLGPQAAVQRLLELKENVAAWEQAAVIASHTAPPTSEDLLVQVLRHCRVYDGTALDDIAQHSLSERDTDEKLRQTAVGGMVVACAGLQDVRVLSRLCETVLSEGEFALLSSWMTYIWTSRAETV